MALSRKASSPFMAGPPQRWPPTSRAMTKHVRPGCGAVAGECRRQGSAPVWSPEESRHFLLPSPPDKMASWGCTKQGPCPFADLCHGKVYKKTVININKQDHALPLLFFFSLIFSPSHGNAVTFLPASGLRPPSSELDVGLLTLPPERGRWRWWTVLFTKR